MTSQSDADGTGMSQSIEKTHLVILMKRIKALEYELKGAIKVNKIIDERIKALQNGLNTIQNNRQERVSEIESKFDADMGECNRQIKLAQDVLAKKVEERQALLGYLTGLDLNERMINDLRDFEWVTLQGIAGNLHKPNRDLVAQSQKAEYLSELIQETKTLMSNFEENFVSASLARDRFSRAYESFNDQSSLWTAAHLMRKTQINKLQRDNERLNILLRQCVTANMTDYLAKNVQAKCQSFLNCESPEELSEGLKKFKNRQERVIKLLRHKDDQLGVETNKLEVAKDQTHDQLKYYSNLIASRRSAHMNRILGTRAQSQLQTASGA